MKKKKKKPIRIEFVTKHFKEIKKQKKLQF